LNGKEDYLTQGEAYLLLRKRLLLTQSEMAAGLHISRHMYSELERDKLKEDYSSSASLVLEEGVQPSERCLIYRKRAKMTQEQVAKELKKSRLWVNKMENGYVDCDELIWFWEC
jgi:transcriptional regulator with XRE-family HTH domain